MKRLRRFLRMSPVDQRLLLGAALVLALIRLGLWVLPFRAVRGMASRFARISGGAAPMQRVGWAVNAASRVVPKATCLTRALATQVLLGRPGQSSRLRIGVIRDCS
jgi:type II secretory pathway component PulM